jgi:hypothetical protein
MERLGMKKLPLLCTLIFAGLLGACTEKKVDPTAAADWRPEEASVAKHITSVHHFMINPSPEAHLRVDRDPESGRIVGEFRKDVLEILGGEKALYVMGWDTNPQISSRHEYLFFLEALHAYLVLNHPEWDGGESESAASAATTEITVADPAKTVPAEG